MKITAARITEYPKTMGDPLPSVYITIGGKEQRLFDFYPDEIAFLPQEFIGLTAEEAIALKHNKDRAFLRS